MSGFWAYVLNTKWDVKKRDFARYRELVARCRAARDDVEQAYEKITRHFHMPLTGADFANMDATKKCIRTYMGECVHDNTVLVNANVFVSDLASCPNFSHDEFCANYKCPLVYDNALYHRRLNTYEKLVSDRRAFWPKRFQRTK